MSLDINFTATQKQMRTTADKSLKLLLTTFSSLREELVHLQDDSRRLENDKEMLEKELSFKVEQVKQYERLMESVREHNRQIQQSLKDSNLTNRKLEGDLLSLQNQGADSNFQMKELECSKEALKKENEALRMQVIVLIYQPHQLTTEKMGFSVEIERLQQERLEMANQSKSVIITKKYRNQYPILGLLYDDYKVTSPVKEEQTIVIKRTGEMYKQEFITSP
nr:PREDICTED: protein POF1B-like [Latimeria chalumnae]|eukprot:XP_014353310.1 PREDICTED: protein POF1B-like [Latimeria chalumnae]